MYEFLKEINDKFLSKYGDVMMVGDCGLVDQKEHPLIYLCSVKRVEHEFGLRYLSPR